MFEQQVRQIPFYFIVFVVLMLAFLGIVASSLLGPERVAPLAADVSQDANSNTALVPSPEEADRVASLWELIRQEVVRSLAGIGERLRTVRLGNDGIAIDLENLQDNDAGKRIAGSDEHYPKLVALIRYAPELASSLNKINERYSALVASEVASSTEAELKSVKLSLNDFDTELAALEQNIEDFKAAFVAINTVCQELPPAAITVRAKLRKDEERETLSFAQKLKEIQDAATRDQQQKLQNAEKERTDAKASLEAATKRLDALKLRQQAATAEAGSSSIVSSGRAAQDLAALEADYQSELSEINRWLAPLLAHGYSQPEHAGYQRRAREKGPMSLAALRSCGALTPTDKGLQYLGLAMTYANDRGSFGFPQYFGGALQDQHYQYLIPAQKLLIKYQYLLVDKKRLAE